MVICRRRYWCQWRPKYTCVSVYVCVNIFTLKSQVKKQRFTNDTDYLILALPWQPLLAISVRQLFMPKFHASSVCLDSFNKATSYQMFCYCDFIMDKVWSWSGELESAFTMANSIRNVAPFDTINCKRGIFFCRSDLDVDSLQSFTFVHNGDGSTYCVCHS